MPATSQGMSFADSASCRYSHYVVVARTLDTASETKRLFNTPCSRDYATGYSRVSPVPSRYDVQCLCSDIPLSFERQVSVNPFKIGAVGEHFAIRVYHQNSNGSSPRDSRRKCPCIIPSILTTSDSLTYGMSCPSKRAPPRRDPRAMAQGSCRQVTRISGPDYPLTYLFTACRWPRTNPKETCAGPLANSPIPCDQHRSRTFASQYICFTIPKEIAKPASQSTWG